MSSNDNNGRHGRVPVIPLSYTYKDKAVSKELIVDYETGNIYIKNTNGELMNVFQAAMKIDNQWISSSARLNKGRSWHATVGTQNAALAIAGMDDTIESWNGAAWTVGVLSAGINGASCDTAAAGSKDAAIILTNNFYKYENSTISTLLSYGLTTSSGRDMVGNSTTALFRCNSNQSLFKFNAITKAVSTISASFGSYSFAYYSQESFGNVSDAIFIRSSKSVNSVTKYNDVSGISSLDSIPNSYRNRFGSCGNNSSSGMIFGGSTVTGSGYTYDYSSTLNSSEEWLNGLTWKVSSYLPIGSGALSGAGTSTTGLAVGGYLADGSKSTFTQRYNNTDGISYLKSLVDNMEAMTDVISTKMIDNVFDCFVSIGDVADFAYVNSSSSFGFGCRQNNAITYNGTRLLYYDKISKAFGNSSYIKANTSTSELNFGIYTDGDSDSSTAYIVYGTEKENKCYEIKNNAIPKSISTTHLDLCVNEYNATTGKSSGIQYEAAMNKYCNYNFAETVTSVIIDSNISNTEDTMGVIGGGDQNIAYFTGGVTASSIYNVITEKIVNLNTTSISQNKPSQFAYLGQSNLIKYGNYFIAPGSTTEKFDTISETWSVENYSSNICSGHSGNNSIIASNGNTSSFGMVGCFDLNAMGNGIIRFEELTHANVLDSINSLLNQQDKNIAISYGNTFTYVADSNYVPGDIMINSGKLISIEDRQDTSIVSLECLLTDLLYSVCIFNNKSLTYIYDTFKNTIPYNMLNPLYIRANTDNNFNYKYIGEIGLDGVARGLKDYFDTLNSLILILYAGKDPYSTLRIDGPYSNDTEIGNILNLLIDGLCDQTNNDDVEGESRLTKGKGLIHLMREHFIDSDYDAHPMASRTHAGYMNKFHYTLLEGATTEYDGDTLVKRDSRGNFKIRGWSGYVDSTSSATIQGYPATMYWISNYYIRNKAAKNEPNAVQTMGSMLQAYSNTNYTTAQMRNIVLWVDSSSSMPSTNPGDIVIKTF